MAIVNELQPNLPIITVTDKFDIANISDVLLGEFAAADVREILSDNDANMVAQSNGMRIARIIDQEHNVVTEYDPKLDKVPLEFINEERNKVVASARPGTPYKWQVVKFGALSEDGNYAPIVGVRLATDDEAQALSEMYPKWLEMCQKFDEDNKAKEAIFTQQKEELSELAPPVLH